jgi:S-DNA-T family DNA segregation ATPase FtsK/SpoIIIE
VCGSWASLSRVRAQKLAGTTRMHQPTRAEPFVVVMIDELAAVIAHISDRQLRLRAETALKLLCSQGRAVGFMVFARLQDPRKEVLPARGLFTQTVGLRLREPAETTVVLGEGALNAGAKCHHIPRYAPGVGYITPEDGGPPINVRAGSVSDEAIQLAAKRFPAPKAISTANREPVGGLK